MSGKGSRTVTGATAGRVPEIPTPSVDLASLLPGLLLGGPSAVALAAGAGMSNRVLNAVADRARDPQSPERKAADKGRALHEARGEDAGAEHPGDVGLNAWFGEVDEFVDPDIQHDHGHLEGWADHNGNRIRDEADWQQTRTHQIDETLRETPTLRDYASLAKWVAMLEGAELLRPDLVDATATYRHFLFGNGALWTFSYDRFLRNDSAGAVVERSAIQDAEYGVMSEYDLKRADGPSTPMSFRMQSNVVSVGSDARYPYPATENWQKAIGGHPLWIQVEATVTPDEDNGERHVSMDLTLCMEDMYNFNPGQLDITTGTPDAENGRFEIVGLGHEFLQRGEATRHVQITHPIDTWDIDGGSESVLGTLPGRESTPENSRNPVAR